MSKVLTVTPSKKSTIKLDYHFQGCQGVSFSKASLSLPEESEKDTIERKTKYELHLVVGKEMYPMTVLTKDIPVVSLDASCYSNFSLKLVFIGSTDSNVENVEESFDASLLTSVSVLCHPIERRCENVHPMFTYIQTCTLNAENMKVELDSQIKSFEVVLAGFCLTLTNTELYSYNGVLNFIVPGIIEKFPVAKISCKKTRQNVEAKFPIGSALEVDLYKQIKTVKENSGSLNAVETNGIFSADEISEPQLKCLFHVAKADRSNINAVEHRCLFLKPNVKKSIEFSLENIQNVSLSRVSIAFPAGFSTRSKYNLIATLNKSEVITIAVLTSTKPFVVISEKFCQPIDLSLEANSTDSTDSIISAMVSYKVSLPTSQAKPSSEVTESCCLSCKDVNNLFSVFAKIRDKFAADVAYMRENYLFGCDTLLIGDSILRYVDPSILNGNVYVQSLGGCTIEQLDYIITVLSLDQLKRLIVHIGVNNTHGNNNVCNVSEQASKYRALVAKCKERAPNAKLYLSSLIARFDKTYCNQWVSNLNCEILQLCNDDPSLTFVSQKSVAYDNRGQKIGANFTHDNLHISEKGTRSLLININSITKISDVLPDSSVPEPNISFETATNESVFYSGIEPSVLNQSFDNTQTFFYQTGSQSLSTAVTSTPSAHSAKQLKVKGERSMNQIGSLDFMNSESVSLSASSKSGSSSAEDLKEGHDEETIESDANGLGCLSSNKGKEAKEPNVDNEDSRKDSLAISEANSSEVSSMTDGGSLVEGDATTAATSVSSENVTGFIGKGQKSKKKDRKRASVVSDNEPESEKFWGQQNATKKKRKVSWKEHSAVHLIPSSKEVTSSGNETAEVDIAAPHCETDETNLKTNIVTDTNEIVMPVREKISLFPGTQKKKGKSASSVKKKKSLHAKKNSKRKK